MKIVEASKGHDVFGNPILKTTLVFATDDDLREYYTTHVAEEVEDGV